ncbi:Efflux pump periplasmic linker BepF [Fundidesulfovibrio magnetotacticus]|uniref:Efflux pump periplasmic linker BepF n=1 Tax=Fundidesulfovibrio magnetotacticus TaxID=2730080 RepID=A0A6V8LQD9_9BACT|nr:efflux RND transporter periplasmic adaptor subunit [Fundidesulfovibrio magnetotacticus]GFK93190.1 Efflux pump periplasmic linker BepF [Fundidesulfovibrio magnetotacticus]
MRQIATPLAALLAALTLAALAACDGRNAYVPPPPPEVTVAKPVRQRVVDYLEFTGNTQAVQTVNLTARVEGFLQQIKFADGQDVKKGQLLFVIEPAPYQAKVERAQADVDSAKARLTQAVTELARAKKLFAERAGPDTEVVKWQREHDSAKADLESAKASLDIARINLGYTQVTAPFDGRVSRRMVDAGNLVGSGGQATVLATVIKEDPIYAYFSMSERDLLRIQKYHTPKDVPDERVTIEMGLSDQTGYPIRGHLDYYDLGVDPQTGTLLLRAIYPNPERKLFAGLFVRLRAPLESRDALTVPEGAVGVDQVGHYVLVVGEKNVVRQQPVTVGQAVNGLRVIDKGLEGGESVIVTGLQMARPGAPVNPSEAKK